MLPTEVETARLRLRPWEEDDVDAYARICSHPEVMQYMADDVLTRGEARQRVLRFIRHWEEHGFGWWAAEDKHSGRVIGRIGLLYREDWSAGKDRVEVGWLLDHNHWGKGLATEGAHASLSYGFEKLKLPGIISLAVPQNQASQRIMNKVGMTFRGYTSTRSVHVVWYDIDHETWEKKLIERSSYPR